MNYICSTLCVFVCMRRERLHRRARMYVCTWWIARDVGYLLIEYLTVGSSLSKKIDSHRLSTDGIYSSGSCFTFVGHRRRGPQTLLSQSSRPVLNAIKNFQPAIHFYDWKLFPCLLPCSVMLFPVSSETFLIWWKEKENRILDSTRQRPNSATGNRA